MSRPSRNRKKIVLVILLLIVLALLAIGGRSYLGHGFRPLSLSNRTSAPVAASVSPSPSSSSAAADGSWSPGQVPPQWTQDQINTFEAAWNGDSALRNAPLACFMAVVPKSIPANLALDYVSVAWVDPAPSDSQISQGLVTKYGQSEGMAAYNAWSRSNWGCGNPS